MDEGALPIPDTRYVTRRGKSLAYQVYGEGPHNVAVLMEANAHPDLMWTDPHFVEGAARLAGHCRVVLMQQMGIGLSDSIDKIPTLEEQASDLEAVLDAEGMSSATLLGVLSMTLPIVVLAANAPERVEALVLLTPYAQGIRNESDYETAGFTPAEAERFLTALDAAYEHWGEGLSYDVWDPVIAPRNRRIAAMLERSSASPAAAAAVFEAAFSADVREILPLVRAPTRVIRHPTHLAPKRVAQIVAELIPHGTFHEIPPSHPEMSIAEALMPVFDHVLEAAVGSKQIDDGTRQLASILFTDVVSSTELVESRGDADWRALLDRHEGQIRGHVDDAGGRVVKMIGDGSMSVFTGPAAAIRAARAIAADARSLDIEVRAGVHAGECDRRPGGDISGLAVHIAARVQSAAAPGEIWVSRTVRDLVGGSGLELEPRGRHSLKGVSEPWELYLVAGEDVASTAVEQQPTAMRPGDHAALALARRAPRLMRRFNQLENARQKAVYARRRRSE